MFNVRADVNGWAGGWTIGHLTGVGPQDDDTLGNVYKHCLLSCKDYCSMRKLLVGLSLCLALFVFCIVLSSGKEHSVSRLYTHTPELQSFLERVTEGKF